MSGKGSKIRPIQIDRKVFEKNWKRIFEEKKSEEKNEKIQNSV